MSIVEKLRDPIWQAWGTLVGLLALLISTFVAYDVSSRDSRNSTYLTIYDGYSYQLFSGKKPENIIVSVDGTPINSVGIYRTSIRNTGLTAIRPEDFIEPIRITLKTIPYHLLSVDIGQISPSELDVKWTQITTNTFELKPLLLNSGDSFEVLLYYTDFTKMNDTSNLSYVPLQPSDFQWKGRVTNVKTLFDKPPTPLRPTTYLGVFFRLSTWRAYSFGIFSILLNLVGVILGVRLNRLPKLSVSNLTLISLIAGYSFAIGGIIATCTFPLSSPPPVGWLIIASYGILMIYIIYPLIVNKIEFLLKKSESDILKDTEN